MSGWTFGTSKRTTMGLAAALCVMAVGIDATWRPEVQRSRRGGNMNVTRNGSQPSTRGPSEYFTGTVRVDSPFQRTAPSVARVSGAIVTFEPGARTAWHTHPFGQTLIVTSGLGQVQRVGGAIEDIAPGDVVWIEPGEKHWHGASPTTAMTRIAIAEMLDGTAVEWMEKVTDAQYGGDGRVRQE